LSSDIRKRNCYFCKNGIDKIDYKDKNLLVKFTTPSGRILSSRITRVCPKHQRKIQRAVKRAREIALIPFVETSYM
jgi:small subunit ribosomal protein S18